MRIILFLLSMLMISCSAGKSPSNNQQAQTTQTAQPAPRADSLQIDTTVDFVTGQFDFHDRNNFIKVPSRYTNKEIYLQKRTYQAFKKMADRAKKDGITLTVISGTRNFNYQKSIWDRKWKRTHASTNLQKAKEILKFSSMPMTSRHHWGTDLDLNNLNNSYFEKGKGKKEYEWLKTNANSFGFYQPYTNKSLHNRTGYEEEKWHWSYMPLADKYLDYYNAHISNADISGFKGSDLAPKIDMVGKYVNGVSLKIKQYDK